MSRYVASEAYPVAIRRTWPDHEVWSGHSRYVLGARDLLSTAMESEYQRRVRGRRRARQLVTWVGDASCSICGGKTRVAKPVCRRCLDAFGLLIAGLSELPARSA